MTKIKFYFILVGLACSLFLSAIDSTIVATAMPKILEEFKQFQSISLPSVAYMLALCTLAPIYGRLSDILGRKPVILSAIVLCVAGSVMCGAAKSFTVLTVGRAIQGAGGAGMFALPLILIADLSPPRQASVYISLMGVVVALSTVMGPILGGAFAVSETLTWRSSFYLNGPVGFVAVVILFFFLHIPPMHLTVWTRLGTLDYGGAFIFVVAMTCLLLAFSWGGLDYPWSDKIIIILLCVGIVMTVVFVVYEIKVAKDPLIPMRLFRNRNLVIAILVNVSIGVAMYGTVYYIPLYWAYVHQLDSVQSGLRLLPFMLSVSLSSGVCGAICSKRGYYRWFIRIGAVLMCAFFTSLKVIETDKYTLGMHIGLLVGAGIGVGMCFQPATVAAQAAVEPEDMAVATTLLSFFRTVAAVIGLSVQNSILFNKLGNLLKEAIMEAGGQLPGGLPAGAAVDASEILKGGEEVLRQLPKEQFAIFAHAFTKALGWVFLGTMPFVAIGIFASVFMKHIPLR
ncbi:MFS general substrate transporter, partial [Ramicandelaber brevisporus]